MHKIVKLSFLVFFVISSCKKEEKQMTTDAPQTTTEMVLEQDTIKSGNDLPVAEPIDLPFEIEGEYRFADDVASCEMHLKIFSVKGMLKYELKTGERNVMGDAEISKEDSGNFYITFKDIEWSENKGLIDPEGNTPDENLPIPTEIMAGLRDNQIIFQNYGNAENYFIILKECDVKYVFFEKVL